MSTQEYKYYFWTQKLTPGTTSSQKLHPWVVKDVAITHRFLVSFFECGKKKFEREKSNIVANTV